MTPAGRFHWLAGFGERRVQLADTKAKTALHPVWSLQTHFKVTITPHPAGEVDSSQFQGIQESFIQESDIKPKNWNFRI